jgi:hypothetical protein
MMKILQRLQRHKRVDHGKAAQAALRYFAEASREDLFEIIPALCALLKRVATEHWWINPEVYAAFERCGFHLTQDAYYSPLPNVAEMAARYPAYQNVPIPAAEALCDRPNFLDVWNEAAAVAGELAAVPRKAPHGYCWDNDFFPNLDAIVYYGLIRSRRPAVVVEIGAGFSTHVAALALRRNGAGKLHVIDPYPTAKLMELTGDCASFLQQKIQDVPIEFFAELRAGDFLFVDSSHVSKTDSDLHRILFGIIPRLPPGILLHFHDIFLPYEYPAEWVIGRNWAWNEQYLVLAWLMGNQQYVPLIGSQALLRGRRGQVVAEKLGGLDVGPLSGASFWVM